MKTKFGRKTVSFKIQFFFKVVTGEANMLLTIHLAANSQHVRILARVVFQIKLRNFSAWGLRGSKRALNATTAVCAAINFEYKPSPLNRNMLFWVCLHCCCSLQELPFLYVCTCFVKLIRGSNFQSCTWPGQGQMEPCLDGLW